MIPAIIFCVHWKTWMRMVISRAKRICSLSVPLNRNVKWTAWIHRLKHLRFLLVSMARWICLIWQNCWGLPANMIPLKPSCKVWFLKTQWLRMTLFRAGRQPMSIFPAMWEVSWGLHRWLHRKTVLLKSMCRHWKRRSRRIWMLLKLMSVWAQHGLILPISSSSCRKLLKLRIISAARLRSNFRNWQQNGESTERVLRARMMWQHTRPMVRNVPTPTVF